MTQYTCPVSIMTDTPPSPPYTWAFFKRTFHNNHVNTKHRFQRAERTQKTYDAYRRKLVHDHVSIRDAVIALTKLHPTTRPLSIDPNMFPYDLEARLHHWVVWVHPDASLPDTFDIDTYVRRYFHTYFDSPLKRDKRLDLVWFRNDLPLQSVPSIPHYQVIMYLPPHSLHDLPDDHTVPVIRSQRQSPRARRTTVSRRRRPPPRRSSRY